MVRLSKTARMTRWLPAAIAFTPGFGACKRRRASANGDAPMSALDQTNDRNIPAPQSPQPPQPPARVTKALARRRQSPQLTTTDREFLPAALEILVAPPSPIARALLVAICGLFFAALAWSYFGWMDIYAVAPGKIQPDGGSKVVQPLDAGKVVAIEVANGS